MIIYKISNFLDDKVYIGSTSKSLKYRWAKHKSKMCERPGRKLYKHIDDLGIENFVIEEICQVVGGRAECLAAEQKAIEECNSILNGLNTRRAKKN